MTNRDRVVTLSELDKYQYIDRYGSEKKVSELIALWMLVLVRKLTAA